MKTPLLLAALTLAACDVDRTLAGNPDLQTPDLTQPAADLACIPLREPKLDVLFMVDNSWGMVPMQERLAEQIDEFIKPFNDFGNVDLHVGVVTSDYGAGATGAPGCQPSPGGQRGQLQGIPGIAPPHCQPPVGAPFVSYQFGGENNLPIGQDLAATLRCMVSVGANGCGFEHPLESVYAALQNRTENAGFLRDDAALLVVFYTNEDDCSAPPTTEVFDKNRTAEYGYESSFRCTRFGVFCGGHQVPYGRSTGPLSDCTPGHPVELYDTSRYIERFLISLKHDPGRVALAALDAPSTPVEVILSNPGTPSGTPYVQCDQLNEATNPPCIPVLQHSCQNPQIPTLVGDPAVRLNTVVSAIPNHRIHPICDTDLSGALQDIAQAGLSAITCR